MHDLISLVLCEKLKTLVVEVKPTVYFRQFVKQSHSPVVGNRNQPSKSVTISAQVSILAVSDLISEAPINTGTLINGGQDKGRTWRPPSPSDGVSNAHLFLSHWSICFTHNPQAPRLLPIKANAHAQH